MNVDAARQIRARRHRPADLPRGGRGSGTRGWTCLARSLRSSHLRSGSRGLHAGHDLRPRLAHQGDCDDDGRDAPGGRGRAAARRSRGRMAVRLEGQGSRSRDVRDLLAHCSGLSAHLPLYESYSGRMEFQRVICGLMLEYAPRTQSIYSDMGFMLLGWIAEDAGGASLSEQHTPIAQRLSPDFLEFSPPRSRRPEIAPTEIDKWRGRLLIGEVHDPNCWALGGEAGHAGLFGTASATGGFAQLVLRGLTKGDDVAGEAGDDPDVRAAYDRYSQQHARARLGHDEADVVVRLEDEPDGDRSHRLHRHVAVDRLGARPVRGAADQSRPPDRLEQRDPAGASGVS